MTANVALRTVRDDDLAVFFAQQKDPAASHMVAFTARDPADRDAFMAHWANIRGDKSVALRTILCDDHVAGYMAQFERAGKYEIGYFLGQEFWGRGIATAALSQFLADVTARPLYAGVAEDNVASMRVLQECGFVVVGKEKTYAKARGETINEIVMRLD